jgi:predicted DNA-binding protein with PD1-like motif
MRYRRDPSGLLLVCLQRGDWVRDSVESLCRDLGLQGAQVSGIGGLHDPELGFWQAAEGDYSRRVLKGSWELLSLLGNISLYEGKPFAHLHATLANADLEVRGGHFFEGQVTATAELFLQPCQPLLRLWDDRIKAGLWQVP